MNIPKHILLCLMIVLCFVATSFAGKENNYSCKNSPLSFVPAGRGITAGTDVNLFAGYNDGKPSYDDQECNKGAVHFSGFPGMTDCSTGVVRKDANAGTISGTSPLCIGATPTYTTDGDAGGTWSSTSPSVATIDPVTGVVTAIHAGTTTITYSVNGNVAPATKVLTVNPDANPGAISGATTLCIGTSSPYTTNGDAGGNWSTFMPSGITVDPVTGVVTAISAGTSWVIYTAKGCLYDLSAYYLITVSPDANAGTVSGTTPLCIGAMASYTSNGDVGGIWSSSSPSVATVDPVTGKVTAIGSGTSSITYKMNGCTAPSSNKVVTVSADASAGILSGTTPLCIGATASYTTSGDAGGAWSSSSPSVATVNPVTGVITAISAGTSVIKYMVSGCGTNLSATQMVTVSPVVNAGILSGATPLCIGTSNTYTTNGDAGGSWSSSSPLVATVNPVTGVVTAISPGTSVITYKVSDCAATSTKVVTVSSDANAGTISGTNPLCIGTSSSYTTNGNAGGSWSSSSPLIATVNPVTGVVTAISPGTSVITYTVSGCGTNLSTTKVVMVNPDSHAGTISGATPLCMGVSSTYSSNGDAGGVWSSSSPSIATVDPVTGMTMAISAGTSLMTYTVSGCGTSLLATKVITVNPDANAGTVNDAAPLCIGASTSYTTNGDAGGVWSSASPSVATVNPVTGTVTAISTGTSVITYIISGCGTNLSAGKVITVNLNANAGLLSGASPLCINTTTSYTTNGDAGGVWSSASPSVATVNPVTGVVTAISAGASVISYTVSGCGTNLSANKLVTVSPDANPGTVSGTSPLCIGATASYTTNGDEGGIWSSASPSVATVNPVTGVVTAISAGTSTITYTVSGCGTNSSTTKSVTVILNANAGTISGATPLCIGAASPYATNGDAGGAWTSASPSVATVDPVTGVVTAISAGGSVITYTVSGCGTNLSTTKLVTVSPNANAGLLSGVSPLCINATTSYTTNGDAGGSWSSTSPSVAIVNPVTGVVTAIGTGTTTIAYTVSGCAVPATKVITVIPNANPGILSGVSPLCIGTSATYTTNGDAGGVWSSASPLVATVNPVTGVVTAISAGTCVITYTVNGCGTNLTTTKVVTVSPGANSGLLSGASPLCIGATASYTTNGDAGGSWSSTSPSVAIVDPVTGTVTAMGAGTSTISYNISGCASASTKVVTVRPNANAGTISGTNPLCIGATASYTTNGDAGGSWSSASAAIATVDPVTGMVTAISAGTTIVTYTVSGCGPASSVTKLVTVSPDVNAGIISGGTPLCIGVSSTYATNGDPGGVWSSSSPSIATVKPATGVVKAISAGISVITYTVTGCGTNLNATKVVTVSPNAHAGTISGVSPLCIGVSSQYTSNGDAGGSWSSASPAIATVDPVTGLITAISAGTSVITYTVTGCTTPSATKVVTVKPDVNAGILSGASPLCIGVSSPYTTSGDAGGVWSSSSPSVATVNPVTGVVTGISVGTAVITYTVTGCGPVSSATKSVTVILNANAGTINGASPLCIGTTTPYTTNGDAGGTWSSSSPSVATVDPVTGLVTAISAGTSVITYSVNPVNGCTISTATKVVTVSPDANAGLISGASPLCTGATTSYTTNGDAGGTWSSAAPSVATVDPVTGLVTAISAGTSVITYTVSGCGTNLTATKVVAVNPGVNAGTITGASPLCIGVSGSYTTNGVAGGVWGSTSPSVATVNPVTGMVTAISAGTTTITYTVSGCSAASTKIVTVSPNANAGILTGASPLCIGTATSYTTNGDAGGVWSSASPAIATVDPVTGVVTAISAGTSVITYTVSGCGTNLSTSKLVTTNVGANAGTISGATPLCIGVSAAYTTSGDAGGVWGSTSPSIATVDAVTGVVTAISSGITTITYTVNGCTAASTKIVAVGPAANAGIVSGANQLCIGMSTPYTTNGDAGGVWSSASSLVAIVNPVTGVINATGAGITTITYTVSGCGTNLSASEQVTVNPDVNAGIVSGVTPLCIGATTTYTSSGNAYGVWVSSSPSVATVDQVTGMVTAISAGTSTITYRVSGCGTNLNATKLVTVNPAANAGILSGVTPVCIGTTTSYTTNGATGGSWSSTSPLVATVDPVTGMVTAISTGTTSITYSVGSCPATSTKVITVIPNANAGTISGATPLCIGVSGSFTTTGDAGGVWSSTSPSIATVDPVTGIVTAISAGTTIITYTVSGCGSNVNATKLVTVNPIANSGLLSGATPLCIGVSSPYITNGDAGGSWSSTSPLVATVDPVTGIVTAVSAGTTTITYTVSGCTATSTKVITVSPDASAGILSGVSPLCIGTSVIYTTTGNAGGAWISTSPSVATVDPVTGRVTAMGAGTSTITYTVIGCGTNLVATRVVTVSHDSHAGIISGATPLCIGATSTYTTNGDAGGLWNSASPSVVTVDPVTGMITAISAGTSLITYTVSGCGANLIATKLVTVNSDANAGTVNGATPVCIGATTPYTSNGDGGGVWSSASPLVATVDPVTGILTAINIGTSLITYTVSGCGANFIATKVVTVSPDASAGILSGASPLCRGGNSAYTTSGDAGGIWSSASPSVATVDPLTGMVTAISAGTSVITYMVSGCGTNLIATKLVTVSPDANAGILSGATPLCIGATTSYTTNGDTGGIWSSASPSMAPVDPVTGEVTAINAGTSVITYTISGCGTNLSTTKVITVSPNAHAGILTGASPLCIGSCSYYTSSGDAGGSWTSSSPLIATVNSVTGEVKAISAGTTTITYTVSGCAVPSSKVVTVSPNANPGTVSGATSLCIGSSSPYIANGDAGGSWSTFMPSGITVDPVTGIVTAISAGTSWLIYTAKGGQCNLSAYFLVNINPNANAGTISGVTPLCKGATTTYSSNGDIGGSWTSTSLSVATVDSATGVITAIGAGTTTITYTVKGCAAPATKVLTVSPDVNPGILSGVTPLCMGTSDVYTTNGDAGGVWSSASPSVATVDPVTGLVTAISAGTSIITYTISNNNNCTKSVSTAIIVNGLSKASFNSSLVQICENSIFLIDSTYIHLNRDDNNTSQYQWYINDSLIGLTNYFPGYTITNKDNLITIKLKTISSFGCNNDSTSKSINFIHIPKPSFSLSDTTGCGPLNINFSNTTPGIAYNFQWDFGNGTSSNLAQPAGITYTYAGSGLDTAYTISLTAYSQCDTVTISKKIVVKRKAKIDFTATPTIGCSPMKVLFNNNSIGDSTLYKLWFGDGTDTVLTIPSVSHYYYTGLNTIYNSKLVATNSCGSDSVSIPIMGAPNAIKPDIYVKDSVLCGSPNMVTIYNKTIGANKFDWDFGDGTIISSSKSPDSISHVYTQNGSYTISAHINNNCSDTTILRNIHLYSIPKIDFTAVPQSICLGDSVHFRALTDTVGSVSWLFGDGAGSVQFNPVHSYGNAGIFNVLLKAANSNNTCYDSIVKPVEVIAAKQGYMQVSDTIVGCTPFTVTFINRSTPSVSTQWNFGDGSTAKGDTVKHVFIANGNYEVTMLAVSPGGCKYADSTLIRVATPDGTLIYNSGLSCTKGPIKFEATTTNADSIKWDFGDGTTLTSDSVNTPVYHTYPKAGIYLPKAWIIGYAGCSVVKNRSDTIKIEEVIAAYNLAAIYDCGKTTFNFIDTSRSFFGINNWSWNIGPSSFSNQKNITQVFTQAGAYPVTLIVTGNTGCRDTLKSSIQVAIYQYPKVNINGIAAVCRESLISLQSQVISNDSIRSLLWDLGNGFTSSDSIVQMLYNSSGSYQVKLTVSTINKCFDSVYKQLTVYSTPVISLNRTNTVCRGSSIDILASGATSYIWKDANDSIICNGCNSINVTPLNNVQYKIIGYNQYGCSKIDSASINVIQPFSLTVSPDDSICVGSEKKLFANGANSYSWYPENSLNNCTSATVYASPSVTTTYRVIGKDKNNCFADTSHVTVIVGNPTPLDIGRDTIMQSGATYTFNPILPSPDIIKWSWSGISNSSCNNCPNPQAKIVYDVCISCTITNSYSCQTSDTLCIKTFCPEAEVFVPNVFTPDGDGINDKLMVQGKGIKLIKSFRIFNRWGEMIFERTNFSPGDPSYAWDGKIRGKLASPDVFVYVCEAICEKGYSSIFKGNTAILK